MEYTPHPSVPVAIYKSLLKFGLKQVFYNVPPAEVQKIIAACKLAVNELEQEHKEEPPAQKPVKRPASSFARLQKAVQKASQDNYDERYKHYPKPKIPSGWTRTISKECPHGHSEWWTNKDGTKAKLMFRKLYKEFSLQVVEVK